MTTPSFRSRVDAVDVVRGIIMIIMALDHTRDYFGNAAVSPTNLSQASIALFYTRWITNICAPVFFLLTGTGAYLALRRKPAPELSRFLITRGLWLIVLEFTVMRFLLQFNVDYRVTMLTVLWALGWSMIVLGGLVRLPLGAVAAFGASMVLLHNLLDFFKPQELGGFARVVGILHSPSVLSGDPQRFIFAAYPVIPWIGVTALGFALGKVYDWPSKERRRALVRCGIAFVIAFVALRFANIYGDPSKWSAQPTDAFTVMSFLNTAKYPPSLLFLLMTLGPALVVLGLVEGRTPSALRPALIVGKVPMFYFLAHFALIHVLAVAVCAVRYGEVHWMFESPSLDRYPVTQPPGWPLSLPMVYLIWVSVVIALYPWCRWYAAFKARRTDWWLSYL